MILAVTGGTGFVGGRVIAAALAAGHRVRALARADQPPAEGVTWVRGSLEKRDSLVRLASGADAVVHVAGVVNAAGPAGFIRGNVEGTANMLAAAESLGVRRFVHVSSLSAREPQLSNYGRSKERAESMVRRAPLDWTIVRPSGVYGPGDREMLDVFRLAARGLALLPSRGRVSLIHVDDLAALLLVLATRDGPQAVLEVDDGTPMTQAELARAVAVATGRSRLLAVPIPAPLLKLAARADRAIRGNGAKLTPDRAGYLVHPDWTAAAERRPDPALWTPRIPAAQGLAATARWYRAHRLL